MNRFTNFISTHVDLDVALLIIVAGIIYALALGYNAPYLAGSYPGAILMGAWLAALLTFPFFLYLLGKYIIRGFHTLAHHA